MFEYLTGPWKGTVTWGYCVDAWVTLKRRRKEMAVIPSPVVGKITDTLKGRKISSEPSDLEKQYSFRKKSIKDSLEVNNANLIMELYDNGIYDKIQC